MRWAAGPDQVRTGRKQRILKWLQLSALGFGAILLSALLASFYFYNHYSSIVEDRVASGFWQSRGGVYAAPKRFHIGDRASAESLVEALERGGYVEAKAADGVFNGSYTVNGNFIDIQSPDRLARITLAGNRISNIKAGGNDVKEYTIESELLIGRTASKRAEMRVLSYDEIPENLRKAILAAEDRRFFSHYGLDPKGIARAFVRNINDGAVTQGGSTITQQLVKNTFLSPERSLSRKFAEAFLSIALENHLSKEEIFALYCNEIYLGQYSSVGIHGVDQAAKLYFGKELNALSLAEAAAIAAMIKNPNRFGPHKDSEVAAARRRSIIRVMAEEGFVPASDAEVALNTPLKLATERKEINTIAPYFVDAATREIQQKFEGDYLNANFNTRVYTTIDTQLQELAEKAVADQLAKLDRAYKGKRLEASIVALDPHTGHVLAMVGGREYAASQFNRATDALRQPGSTFKPFVYATALERGYTPISTFADKPMEFMYAGVKPYKPSNFRDGYSNTNLTLKTALAKSSNVVAVQAAMAVGLNSVAKKAERFGFQKPQSYPSLALGAVEVTPIQLAAAYAAFANGGRRVDPVFVDRIVSGSERTIYESRPSEEQIVSEQTAYMITDMLQAVVERGTARSANNALGKDVVFAGKTGSSKDGWFVGYTPNMVTVAWIGFDDNSDVRSTGGEIALPLWTEFMQSVVRTRPEFGGTMFVTPKGLIEAVVDPETGMLADVYCPHSEKVVLPRSAATNIKCMMHQPRQEVLMAEHTPGEFDQQVVNIPAALEAAPEERRDIDVRPYIDDYEDEIKDRNPGPGAKDKKKRRDDSRPVDDDGLELEEG
ncbi:MAG TPA: PBP1A family penicillin-binding protein [Pyrinomonadaceae bacterium]|nr:PBP1A family penicillin-binding protein [Pyrinomonadaceae bacterium]